jgi:hypothetical protein
MNVTFLIRLPHETLKKASVEETVLTNFVEHFLWNSSAETVKLAAAICKHCAFKFAEAPLQSSSGGLPYITLPDGRISVTIEGKTQTWPNLEAFQQHVQRKRSKLPMHVRYSGNRATAPVRL